MKIHLESNFKLLGSHNIDIVEFDYTRIPVKDFLKILSDRSTKTPEYLNDDGTDLAGFYQVQVNGRPLAFCENGINTVLLDGDAVAIYSNAHDG